MAKTDSTPTKLCTKCSKEKPTSEFHRSKGKSCGFVSHCKECLSSASRLRYIANKESIKERCIAWYAKNVSRMKIANSAYRTENAAKVAIGKAAWAAANIDRRNASYAAGKIANPERWSKYYEKNGERIRAANAAWRAKNQDAMRGHRSNRRARKLDVGGTLSKDLATKLFQLQKGLCPCCAKPLANNYHLDHVMPLALGGQNTDDNIQLLRQQCNNRKHAKHPIDYMQSRGFLL